jgi:hypothetical protein
VRGRGQTIGIFEPPHLSYVALGFASALPSDAGNAAETLRHLHWRQSIGKSEGAPPQPLDKPHVPGTIGEVLATVISGDLGQFGDGRTPWLLLSLGLPEVKLFWPDAEGGSVEETYGLPVGSAAYPSRNAGIQRYTAVHGEVIDALIALWRDTPKTKAGGLLPGRSPALTFVRHETERSFDTSDSTAGRFAFQQPRSPDGEKVDSLDAATP